MLTGRSLQEQQHEFTELRPPCRESMPAFYSGRSQQTGIKLFKQESPIPPRVEAKKERFTLRRGQQRAYRSTVREGRTQLICLGEC